MVISPTSVHPYKELLLNKQLLELKLHLKQFLQHFSTASQMVGVTFYDEYRLSENTWFYQFFSKSFGTTLQLSRRAQLQMRNVMISFPVHDSRRFVLYFRRRLPRVGACWYQRRQRSLLQEGRYQKTYRERAASHWCLSAISKNNNNNCFMTDLSDKQVRRGKNGPKGDWTSRTPPPPPPAPVMALQHVYIGIFVFIEYSFLPTELIIKFITNSV